MDDDWESFEFWVRSRQHRLVRSAFLLTGDVHHAEDLVQDALVKVAQRWPRLQGENVDAYIRRVIFHDYVSWWRRRRARPMAQPPEPTLAPDHSGGVDQRQTVLRALDQLTAKQRAVVVLRFFDDLSENQTADALGIGVGTVKSQTSAALARLRALGPEYALVPGEGEQT